MRGFPPSSSRDATKTQKETQWINFPDIQFCCHHKEQPQDSSWPHTGVSPCRAAEEQPVGCNWLRDKSIVPIPYCWTWNTCKMSLLKVHIHLNHPSGDIWCQSSRTWTNQRPESPFREEKKPFKKEHLKQSRRLKIHLQLTEMEKSSYLMYVPL